MKKVRVYEIARTGKLEQYYTLYEEFSVIGEGTSFSRRSFIQNLSLTEVDAMSKAKILGIKKGVTWYDLIDSPRKEYCQLSLFDLQWKKTEKGFIATPDADFWNVYKAHKTALKEIGLSVFKDNNSQFKVFFKNRSDEQLVIDLEKFEEFKKIPETGNYISGSIGEKITGINGIVESVKSGENQYGSFQKIIFTTGNCQCVAYYTGKKSYQVGDVIKSFIIKDFSIIDDIKTTTVKNIK